MNYLSSDQEGLKRMADMLRSGATMLADQCPECHSPLFKKGEEIWCPKCNKRVIKVKAGEEAIQIPRLNLLGVLESTVIEKLAQLEERVKVETDLMKLKELGLLLTQWLDLLDKIKSLSSEE